MKKVLGNFLFISAAFVAFILVRPIGSEIGNAFKSSPSISEAELEEFIAGTPSWPMYESLKAYFPNDAKYFRDSLIATFNENIGEDEAFSKMFKVGAEIRRKHAASLREAPDQLLMPILQSLIQVISSVDDNPLLCNRVVVHGPGAVPKRERHRIVGAVMESVKPLYRAMYEGQQSPIKRTQATDGDWGNLIEDFYSAGGSDDEFELIMRPDISNPQLCGAMLRFLHVLKEADFLGSDRLRAEVVAAMNEG